MDSRRRTGARGDSERTRVPVSGTHRAARRRNHVVVVDEHDDLREIFEEILLLSGWNVRAYACADDALVAIAAEPPDLLLTDVDVGLPSGVTLARALRADPRTAHVALVGTSNSVTPTPAMLRAFDLFLAKPVDLPTLSAALQAVIARVRGERGGTEPGAA